MVAKSQCSSTHCPRHDGASCDVTLVSINVDTLKARGVTGLAEAVKQGIKPGQSKCLAKVQDVENTPVEMQLFDHSISENMLCNGTVTHNLTAGQHLCIDTDMGYCSSNEKKDRSRLSEFPHNMELNGEKFTFRGVIAFCQPASKYLLGHYIAYCKRHDFTWEK